MKKYVALLLCFSLLHACQTTVKEKEVDYKKPLSDQLGNAVLWYQQSAEMQASYLQAYKNAKLLLATKLDTVTTDLKLAVVVDIDETILDNSPYEARLLVMGVTYESANWKAWCEEANANALPGALDFLNYAHSNGVEIFYISNRKIEVLHATIRNLQKIGAPQSDSSHVMLRTTTSDKTLRRDAVKAKCEVLIYVGDNLTDYDEVYAERKQDLGKLLVSKNQKDLFNNFVMLPNPMYGEWEAALYENDFSLADSLKLVKRREALYLAQ